MEPPRLDGLDETTKARVLLRVGALTGWLGSADHLEDTQEAAKNLLTQSREAFHQIGNSNQEAEAHGELALCYWREGALDEARIQLRAALPLLSEEDSELRAVLLIRAGIVEATAGRSNEALRLYEEAAHDVERSHDHVLKGTFHNSLATLLTRMASVGDRQDYSDRALIEYAAASFHFEQAGNHRYMARVENCLGYLFFTVKRYEDAHRHLDNARRVFFHLCDMGMSAHVDETRARVLLAEGRLTEAERVVRSAIKTFERGAHQALLAEALTTHGVIVARMGNYARARVVLQRSSDIAQTAGDLEGAGRAQLTIIEELGDQTPLKELGAIYRSALQLLVETQDTTSRKRLLSCAGRVITAFEDPDSERRQSEVTSWKDFSFKEHIHNCERVVLERALREAGGSVSKAARLLGFKHHHSLISLLNTRHQELLQIRSAARKRRQPLLSAPGTEVNKPVSTKAKHDPSKLSVLHVEDDRDYIQLIREQLRNTGMRVDSCLDGARALTLLRSGDRYDVIIVSGDLSGMSGLELVLRARSLRPHRNAKIIMPFFIEGFDFNLLRTADNEWRGPDIGAKIDLTRLRMKDGKTLANVVNKRLIMLVSVNPACAMCAIAKDQMSYLRAKLSSISIDYYPVFFTSETPKTDFFHYSDSLKIGIPSFLWNVEAGQPPEALVIMNNPSHLLLSSDGTVIRVWPGSYKDKPVRDRMARQIIAETLVVLDTLNALSSTKQAPVGHGDQESPMSKQ